MKNRFNVILFLFSITIVFTSDLSAELYERAPDVLPGTLPEMRDPSYWIERMRKPDEIILTLDEIWSKNEAYQKKIRTPGFFKNVPGDRLPIPYFYPGTVLFPPDLHRLKPETVADTVRTRIKLQIEYLKSREWGNVFAVKYSDREINTVIEELAFDKVGERIEIRDAITVRTTRLRNVASFYPQYVGTGDIGSHRWDRWSIGLVKIGRPVTVLHTSRSGEHVLVLCESGYGWVRSENIAFGDKRKIDAFINDENFIICTGDRV